MGATGSDRSAGFLTCRIADFPIGGTSESQWIQVIFSPCGFGNPRYSRLGSRRYGETSERDTGQAKLHKRIDEPTKSRKASARF
jgi:hypothetical protein